MLKCEACFDNSEINDGVCACLAGYFLNTTNICTACDNKCSICTNIGQCSKCNTGILYNGNCVDTCPPKLYLKEATCLSCMSSCATCTEADHCSTCNTSMYLEEDQGKTVCVSVCKEGYQLYQGKCSPPCSKSVGDCVTCEALCLENCKESSDARTTDNGCNCSDRRQYTEGQCRSKAIVTATESGLQLSFTVVPQSVTQDMLSLKLNSTLLDASAWRFSFLNNTQILLEPISKIRGVTEAILTLSESLVDIEQLVYTPLSFTATISPPQDTQTQLSPSEQAALVAQQQQEAATTEAQQTSSTSNVSASVGSMIVGDPTIIISMVLASQLISYIPLGDFKLSAEVRGLLIGSNSVNNLPKFFEVDDCEPPTSKVVNFGFNCGNLLINAQKEIILVGIVIFGISLMMLLAKTSEQMHNFMTKILQKSGLSLMKRVMITLAADIFVKICIQFSSPLTLSYGSILGVCVSVIVCLLYMYSLYFLAVETIRSKKALSYDFPMAFNELAENRLSSLYYILFIIQRLIFALILVTDSSGLVQISFVFFSLLLVSIRQLSVYLAFVKVFVRRSEQILMCTTNLCICCFYASILFFEIGLFSESHKDSTIKTSFYLCNYSALGFHVALLLYKITCQAIEIYSATDGLVVL